MSENGIQGPFRRHAWEVYLLGGLVMGLLYYFGPPALRSGWAWGQAFLKGAAAVVDAPLGRGRVLLFGPEIAFRAQSHGTFKFLFNGIYYGSEAPASSQALALSRSD